jgi:hypothetical protein
VFPNVVGLPMIAAGFDGAKLKEENDKVVTRMEFRNARKSLIGWTGRSPIYACSIE